jgi:AmmeMemoRadiSam system protein A
MSPLPDDDRATLLGLARRAIISAVTFTAHRPPENLSPALLAPGGVFVSLHRRGRLRGCVGQVGAIEPLAHAVMRCAVAAATDDPRFNRVTPGELAEIEIELSVLSPPQSFLPHELEIGRHGVMVSRGQWHGLLLPQVAVERRWSRERFLEETCRKAGLDPDAWKDAATRIEGFTAEIFSEKSPGSPSGSS